METVGVVVLAVAIIVAVVALIGLGIYEWREARKRSARTGLPAPSSGWGYVFGGAGLAWCGLASLVASESERSAWIGLAALWLGSVLGVAGVVAIGVTVGTRRAAWVAERDRRTATGP